jgi:hypothetical protein
MQARFWDLSLPPMNSTYLRASATQRFILIPILKAIAEVLNHDGNGSPVSADTVDPSSQLVRLPVEVNGPRVCFSNLVRR